MADLFPVPIVTVNGINRSADHTTNRLAIALQARGLEVHRLTYPTRRWWETRNRRKQYLDARQMLSEMRQGLISDHPVDLVAHSWGCLLAARMMELGGTLVFRNIFLFAPALDRDWIFPCKAFNRMWVIFNRQDRAVWAARAFFLGWHPWGDMGRVGYQDVDDRITNVEDMTLRRHPGDLMHSHYFNSQGCEHWSGFIADRVRYPGAVAP